MILVISPAKTLDLSEETRYPADHSLPQQLEQSSELVQVLSQMSEDQLGNLMNISPKLASLNYQRYQSFSPRFTPENAKQALFTFKGDVYTGFELNTYAEPEFRFAQQHLRILSGLYGLLKPLDLIQPYRLEMGTKLATNRGKNLYEFWGSRVTEALGKALLEAKSDILINLASKEYSQVLQLPDLNASVITPVFKDFRNGKAKVISFFAKQARGCMCDFVIKEKITDPEAIKSFTGMGYAYNPALSEAKTWVFTRES